MLHIRCRRVLRHSVSRHIDDRAQSCPQYTCVQERCTAGAEAQPCAGCTVCQCCCTIDATECFIDPLQKMRCLDDPLCRRLPVACRLNWIGSGMFSVPLQRSVALPDVRQKPWPQLQGARIFKQTNSNETECTSEKACRAVRVLFAGEAEAVAAICRAHAFRGKIKLRAQNQQAKILAGLWGSSLQAKQKLWPQLQVTLQLPPLAPPPPAQRTAYSWGPGSSTPPCATSGIL